MDMQWQTLMQMDAQHYNQLVGIIDSVTFVTLNAEHAAICYLAVGSRSNASMT